MNFTLTQKIIVRLIAYVTMNEDASFKVYNGANVLLGTSEYGAFRSAVWQYIELGLDIPGKTI